MAKRLLLLLKQRGDFLQLSLHLAKQGCGIVQRPGLPHFFKSLTRLGQLPGPEVAGAALERVGRFASFSSLVGIQRRTGLGQPGRGVLQKQIDQFHNH
ncbi:uncharacterized protein METZ01_LOCUS197032, partial [marine metagenome]